MLDNNKTTAHMLWGNSGYPAVCSVLHGIILLNFSVTWVWQTVFTAYPTTTLPCVPLLFWQLRRMSQSSSKPTTIMHSCLQVFLSQPPLPLRKSNRPISGQRVLKAGFLDNFRERQNLTQRKCCGCSESWETPCQQVIGCLSWWIVELLTLS